MPHGSRHLHPPIAAKPGGELTGFKRLSDATGPVGPVGQFLTRTRDLILPPQCLGCGRAVDADGVLCPACWAQMDFIADPMCETCGLPFPHDHHSTICADCARQAPPFRRARSAVLYTDASRRLIIAYKHADRMEAAGLFARWLLQAGEALLGDADIIVPVPLHRRRLFGRRFNQSAVLAERLGRETGVAVSLDALERIKPSPPRGRLKPGERRRAVAGAFRVQTERAGTIAGARVLVVDDVMTTGATAKSVAGRLRRAGAAAIDVLTVARAVRD